MIRIRDDRGVGVNTQYRSANTLADQQVQRMLGFRAFQIFIFTIAALVLICIVITVAMRIPIIWLLLGFMLFVLLYVGITVGSQMKKNLVLHLKFLSLCPACLYDLSGIPIEPDGCRICPECAGAWRFLIEESSNPTPS